MNVHPGPTKSQLGRKPQQHLSYARALPPTIMKGVELFREGIRQTVSARKRELGKLAIVLILRAGQPLAPVRFHMREATHRMVLSP